MTVTRPALHGRDEELSLIRERLGAAGATGRGSTVFVEGRPGLGKTRLLHEASALAKEAGFRVGSAGAVQDTEQLVPFAPLFSALFDGPEPLTDPGERRRLYYLLEQRWWLVEEVEQLLERAARPGPVLLCLDDMQWADAGCFGAIRTLRARLADLPVVWLLAFRAGGLPLDVRRELDEGEGRAGAVHLALRPLEPATVGELVGDAVGAEPDGELLDLAGRTHGIPFLLVELLRGLREEGLVRVEDGRAVLVEARLPARVRESMRERLARLSEPAGRIASVAAVLARTFSFDHLAMMLGSPPATLLGPVNELLEAELFGERDGALSFTHDLVRESVRDTLPASVRRALQRQAVDVMLTSGSLPVEVASELAASATVGDQAAVRTLREAARSLSAADPGNAATLSRQAFDLTEQGDPLRTALAGETALLLHTAGRVTEGRAFAEGLLHELLPPEQEAEILLGVTGMIAVSLDARADAGRRALALPGLPPVLRARHLAGLFLNLAVAELEEDAYAVLPQAEAAMGDDVPATYAVVLAEATLAHSRTDFGRMRECLDRAARLGAQVADPGRELLLRQWRSGLLAALDRYDESLRLITDQLAGARRDGRGMALRIWEATHGLRLTQLGRLADALAPVESVVDSLSEMTTNYDAAAVLALARLAIHRGDAAELRRATAIARGVPATASLTVRRCAAFLLALAALSEGDPAGARRHLCAEGEAERLRVLPLKISDVTDEIPLVRIGAATGDRALVDAGVAVAEERLRLNPGVATIAGTAAHARGLARADGAELDEAVRHLEQSPRLLSLASALEDAGRLAVTAADRDRAAALLGRAVEIYTGAGATWDAARVRSRLREIGVRRRIVAPTRPQRGWAGLTDSELGVVRLVAQGKTNREVAEQLFISTHTVSTHLRHTFSKLDINSRTELARIASQHDPAML